ncbi:Carbohydrate family 9 binding domain-like [Kaistella chaponensis]|uniref:Carbohydrate family 9 binding domain-like n=1 Tax=Kaistella chaponensis TaxID=713588 RepID=A0A1N7MWQ4_9FLAO|nr:carbohydrate binding family 9 domain-containing protein [Kaistella chaponensis]SIS90574.1 Carbohydrate family 9 binding domain-like [Kaistella chaponensis]
MKPRLLSTVLLFFFLHLFSQKAENDSIPRKKIVAVKTNNTIKIDGIFDEEAWSKAPIATNFIQRSPENGVPVPDSLRTEVKILYDDTGVYFGAQMYDPHPEKIAKEMVERDNVGNDDIFGVVLNGYNDKQQSLEFLVMPTGVQYDAKITNDNGEDSSWNGVWYSAAKINEKGWFAEIKIPYSELRFPKNKVQDWGFNIVRRIQRTKVMYDWNLVNN